MSNIRQYSKARRISSASLTGEPSSVKATAPASTNWPISANSFPSRFLLTQATTSTLQWSALWARSRTNSTAAWLSMGGSVLGMQAIEVKPPASAAAVPVSMVSSSSKPGSRRWTCMSISPGLTILPAASITVSPPVGRAS